MKSLPEHYRLNKENSQNFLEMAQIPGDSYFLEEVELYLHGVLNKSFPFSSDYFASKKGI